MFEKKTRHKISCFDSDSVIVFVIFEEFKLKMEWELKLSSAALKQVLTLPPRYFPNYKSARESSASVRRTSLTRAIFKNHQEKHSSLQNEY